MVGHRQATRAARSHGPGRRIRIEASLAAVLSLAADAAFGAGPLNPQTATLPFGNARIVPMLELTESWNDNIFVNNRNRKGSLVNQFRFGIQGTLDRRIGRFTLDYGLQNTVFHSSHQDDFTDHFVGSHALLQLGSRHLLELDGKYLQSHNQRGTYFSQGRLAELIREPDAFHQYSFDAKYRAGALGAPLNLEGVFGFDAIRYDNHPERTARWNRNVFELAPAAYFRLFKRTYALIQLQTVLLDYVNDDAPAGTGAVDGNLDFRKTRYLAGLRWDISEKFKGNVRVGYLQQRFEDRAFRDFDDFSWDLSLNWAPRTYSRLNLTVTRDVQPTVGFGSARSVDSVRMAWTHDWTRRLNSDLTLEYSYVDNKGDIRKDDLFSAGFNLSYELNRWVGIGVAYSYRQQQSTRTDLNYDQNSVMLFISGNPKALTQSESPWRFAY